MIKIRSSVDGTNGKYFTYYRLFDGKRIYLLRRQHPLHAFGLSDYSNRALKKASASDIILR